MSAPRGRLPLELQRLGQARYAKPGHRESCTGRAVWSIRMQGGTYRVALGCACGAIRQVSSVEYTTYGEAEAALGPGWWRS